MKQKKRRGRPIGAKNNPKQHEIIYNMDLQESLPDIPEHGFMGEKTPAVQALEAQNSQKNSVVTENDNLVNTFNDPEPSICNRCKVSFNATTKKVSRCPKCNLRIHLTCLRNGCSCFNA